MSTIEVKVPAHRRLQGRAGHRGPREAGRRGEAEDALVTLESDKATMDVPSPSSGTVRDLKVKVGDRVSEGSVVLTLDAGEAGEAAAAKPSQPGRAGPGARARARARRREGAARGRSARRARRRSRSRPRRAGSPAIARAGGQAGGRGDARGEGPRHRRLQGRAGD